MSFAQEMKDFVDGYVTIRETGFKKRQLDLQEEQLDNTKADQEADRALRREQMAQSKANADRNYALAQERLKISKDAAEAAKYQGVLDSLDDPEANTYAPTDFGIEDTAEDPADDATISTDLDPQFKRGGMVRKLKAAGGAMVDPMGNVTGVEEEDAPAALPPVAGAGRERSAAHTTAPAPAPAAQAIPDAPAAPAAQAQPAGENTPRPKPRPESIKAVTDSAQQVVSDVAPQLIEDAKKPKAAVGDGSEETPSIVDNKGALSVKEWQDLVKTVDPNGAIPAYLQTATVLDQTYHYFMEKGQPQKAAKIAKGILVLNKQMTQTLGALALQAAQSGDMDSAARLMSDAANKFPSGHEVSITPGEDGALSYKISENGEVTSEGSLTTDQFWQLATKAQNGSLYIEQMGQFANAVGKGSKRASPQQALEATSGAYAQAIMATDAYKAAKELEGTDEGKSPEEMKQLRQAALDAQNTYKRYRSQSLQMGIKSTEIDRANRDAEKFGIPAEPTAEASAAGADAASNSDGWLGSTKGGVIDRAIDTGVGSINPVYNAYRAAKGTMDYFTGSGSEPELAAPKDKAAYDALPSGTRFVDPTGKVRIKP